jgi:hypothetical protein
MWQFGLKSLDRDVDIKPMYILADKVSNDNDILTTPNGSDLVAHITGLTSQALGGSPTWIRNRALCVTPTAEIRLVAKRTDLN